MIWRCFAVTSICREVSEGKTTKDALSFQVVQVGIFLFAAGAILRGEEKSLIEIVTAATLLLTSAWYAYSIVKPLCFSTEPREANNLDARAAAVLDTGIS